MLVLQAWRSWRHAKAVAFLAAAAFAAGIGAATAIYTVVNAVMLKPLPYRDGDRFVVILSAEVNDPVHYGSLSFRDAQTYQERTRVFDAFGWFRYAGKNLTFAGEPHHVEGVAVTPPLARQLGVESMPGQWFQDETGVVISAPARASRRRSSCLSLVAFTDGVTDALNPEGEEFGEERLKEVLRGAVGAPADRISTGLAERMREWIGDAEQHDDLTFVVVAVNTTKEQRTSREKT